MKQSSAYTIIISSVVFLVITIIVSVYKDSENRRYEGERFLFPKLSVSTDENSLKLLNTISEIKISNFNNNFSIKRDKENWYLPELANYPAPLDKIKKVIVGVAQLETIEPKTKKPNLHGALGLNDTENKINSANFISLINNKNEEVAAILVGNDSKFGKETRYVRKPNDDQSWLVWRNFDVPKSNIDWLNESLFTIERWRIADIEIKHPNNKKVLITRESYAEQYFKLENLDEDTLPMNPYVGNQIGSALEKLPLVNIQLLSDIKFTGNAVIIVYTTFDGLKITIVTDKIDGIDWAKFNIEYDENMRRELPEDGPINVGLPDMKEIQDVKTEVKNLNNKLNKWVFSLKRIKHERFRTHLQDITKKKDLDQKN